MLSKFTTSTRRLATAERQHISTRVTKNFGELRGVVDPIKLFLTSSFIMQKLVAVSRAWDGAWLAPRNISPSCVNMPNLVTLGQIIWVKVGNTKNMGTAPWDGVQMTPRNMLLPNTYQIWPSCMDVGKRSQKFVGCWGPLLRMAVWLTTEKRFSTTLCYLAKFGHFGSNQSNHKNVMTEIYQNSLTHCILPFKVT